MTASTTTPPPVTWIMPVRNGARYLAETLESLARQTCAASEMLVWDNGSTDGTVELLRQWIPSRLPGRVVTGRPLSLGLSMAALVETARTEWVAVIHADDRALPRRLECQLAAVENKMRTVAVGGMAEWINPQGEVTGAFSSPTDNLSLQWLLLFNNNLIHPNMLLRRQAVLDAGNYRDRQPAEDYDLWLRLAALGDVIAVPENTLQYRIHEGSISTQQGSRWAEIIPAMQGENWPHLLPGLEAQALASFKTAVTWWNAKPRPKKPPAISAKDFTLVAKALALRLKVPLGRVLDSEGFRFSRQMLFGGSGGSARAWHLYWGAMARLGRVG